MPLTFATPVNNPLPNQLTRCRLSRQPIDHGAAYTIPLFVFHAASGKGIEATLVIQNGACSVLRKTVAPLGWEDLVYVIPYTFTSTVPAERGVTAAVQVATGYDQIDAIMSGAGTKAAKADAILTALLSMGVIHAELTGTVS